MVFTENSGLVKIWVNNIKKGRKTFEEVPDIYNLREVVAEVLGTD